MTPMKKLLVTATLIAAAMLTAFSLGGGVLLWAVSGLLMVAAMVVLMTGEIAKQPSEKGITLQTLIVTAVLVLMAGAAGVVIIAITNNAQDNLENQNVGIDERCQPWEIFDPTLDAAGRGGGNGGIESSASGCVRVCYVSLSETADLPTDLAAGNLKMSRSRLTATTASSGSSKPSAATARASVNQQSNIVLPVSSDRSVIVSVSSTHADGGADIELPVLTDENLRIEVSTNQRYCRVWDDTNDQEVASLRSE